MAYKTKFLDSNKFLMHIFIWQIYLVDARNHGDSPHTDDMDYILMGQDLVSSQLHISC